MKSYIFILIAIVCATFRLEAKDYQVVINSNPEGAVVYKNGQKISDTTPAVITISDKEAKKSMLFKFEKEGYETRTVTVSYNKKQLKSGATVYGELREKPKSVVKKTITYTDGDPTVTKQKHNERVNRETPGKTSLESTILRWYFDSDPRGARIYWRVISSVPAEVKNTNETYLTTTPLEETRSFNIQGLTYDNSRDVIIEIKVSKRGYEDQVKRFNVRQAIDQQEVSGFFELVKKETQTEE